jgi:lipoprotein-releasing system permease protein
LNCKKNQIIPFIALRYIRVNKSSGYIFIASWISIIGIIVGNAVVIITLSVSNGFNSLVEESIMSIDTQIRLKTKSGKPFTDYNELRSEVLKYPNVRGVSSLIEKEAVIDYSNTRKGVTVRGINQQHEITTTDILKKVKYGTFTFESTDNEMKEISRGMVIGHTLAESMGANIGSEITMYSLFTVEDELNPIPQLKKYTVTGIYETKNYEYDAYVVYITIEDAQKQFHYNGVEYIRIKTDNTEKAKKTAENLIKKLNNPDYTFMTWISKNRALFYSIKAEKFIIFIVVLFIVIIASFNIFSSLSMLCLEKRREIGILGAMGTNRRSIKKIFLFKGLFIGFIGSTCGIIFGAAACLLQMHFNLIPLPSNVYIIDKVPVNLKVIEILSVYIISILISLGAAVYPALLASKPSPFQVIKG